MLAEITSCKIFNTENSASAIILLLLKSKSLLRTALKYLGLQLYLPNFGCCDVGSKPEVVRLVRLAFLSWRPLDKADDVLLTADGVGLGLRFRS